MTPHPVTVDKHVADMSICYPLVRNITLEYKTTDFNVFGQTPKWNPSPTFHSCSSWSTYDVVQIICIHAHMYNWYIGMLREKKEDKELRTYKHLWISVLSQISKMNRNSFQQIYKLYTYKMFKPPIIICTCIYRGKKSLVLVPGTSWISDRTSMRPNVLRTSKKFTDSLFFLYKDKLFDNRTSKTFDVLARGTSENF